MFKNISFNRITKEIEFAEYSPENKGDHVHVWVNLTRAMHDRWAEIQTEYRKHEQAKDMLVKQIQALAKKAKGKSKKKRAELQPEIDQFNAELIEKIDELIPTEKKLYAWYAEVWSQHADTGTHVSGDEVEEAYQMMAENDHAMWIWLTKKTQHLILLHGNQHLKALAPPQ